MNRLFSFFLILAIVLSACSDLNSNQASAQLDAEDESSETATSEPRADSTRSRGLSNARLADFSLEQQMPKLYALVKSDANMLAELEAYARQVVTGEGIETEGDLLAVLKTRDEVIIPHLLPFLENVADEASFHDQMGDIADELTRLGLYLQTAEGMFIGLGAASVLENKVEDLASAPLKWYLRFREARAAAQSGEYPYLNTEDYRQMVVAGEKLNALTPNPYWEEVQEDFERALLTLTDIHYVGEGDNANSQIMVGEIHTEPYPYLTELGGQRTLANARTDASKFQGVMNRILENTSRISEEPENVYLVVTNWADTETTARSRVIAHLQAGEDVPHYLKVRRGDGKDYYAVAYRFYESADMAEAAMQVAEKRFPQAELIFCSVKDGELYQIGPMAG